MKPSKQLLFAAAALAMAACSNDVLNNDAPVEIRLSSALQMQTRAATDIQSTQFAEGETIDVYINEAVANGQQVPPAGLHQYKTTDANGAMECVSGDQYFPASGNGVTIHALYPTGASTDFTVKENQSEADNYKLSDLMHGVPQAGNPVARQRTTIPLVFKHLLSKVIVTLTPGDGLTANDLQGAKVSIVNALRNVSVDLTTGALSVPATATKGNVQIATTTATSLSGAGIVPPQSFAANSQFIKVVLAAGGNLYYTLPADIKLEGGKAYKYEIKVNLTGLTIYSLSIEDWTDGGSKTGNATMD